MEEKDKYFSYYDQFNSDPKKDEINVLHLHILEKLVGAGLKSHHKVLEAGCGLGELSHLIAQKVKNGQVLSIDISPSSIEKASELWKKQKNLQFKIAEMKAFENDGEHYDFFILSEILQQVSRDKHFRIFEGIKRHSHEDSVIFINLPTPKFSEWKAQNDPESLQAVEAFVNIADLIQSISANGFYLEKVVPYSVFFEENDFQYFIFKSLNMLSNPTPKKKWALTKEKLQFNLMNLLM
ncbi:class I SAM-dependent methyltransferase [Echinicola sp. CAU 1574]|uniref:Class I SAM-dependent methyltransferase n=1 Tax=Echinicola arenosa TaxID=2774144 RepID=A0ABR9AQB3_9BACT|nr:class I SAM-dependent methyltransferase [Echinicola arenosa]MBD8490979.1 class I SAM-dependent methyltransferase [Echinicola arenosa]